jgi:tape measure domain-containing protein
MAKNLAIYKLGVVLDVDGAKGLTALKATDRELKAVDEHGRKAEKSLGLVGGTLNKLKSFTFGSGGSGGGLLPGLSQISQIIPQIGNLAHALISPMKDAAEEGIRFNMLIESAEIGFEGITGGAKESARYVKQLTDFAAANPIFNTQGTVRAARMMSIFGFETRKTTDYLKAWGSAIAAGTGSLDEDKLQGVVTAFGQMRSKGKVSAEEMNQLAERGIPAWEMLSKAIGKTTAETMKLAEQGKLRGDAAVDAITATMNQDPRFAGAADKFAKTLEGRFLQLQDLREVASARATKGLFGSMNRTLEAGLSGDNQQLIQTMASSIDAAITPVAGLIETSLTTLLTGSITGAFSGAMKAGTAAVLPFEGLGFGAIDSLAAGARAAGGKVVSAVQGVASDGVQIVRDTWQQNSPSKVFYGLGFGAMKSLANGLQDGGRGAVTNTEKLVEAIKRAIIGQESGGDSNAVNPFSGATGMGQVMPANIPSWTREALGREMSVKDFRNDPAAQNQTITYKLRQYFNEELQAAGGDVELAMRRVASRWYSGNGSWHTSTRPQKNNHPSIAAYSTSIVNRAKRALSSGNVGSAAADFGADFSAGSARGGAGVAVNDGSMFGAGASFQAGNSLPVRITNWLEASGLRTRDRLEHDDRIDLTKLTPLPKTPVYEGGKIVGYNSGDADRAPAMSNAQAVAGLAKLNVTLTGISIQQQQTTIDRLQALNDELAEMPPHMKNAGASVAVLPPSLQEVKTELNKAGTVVKDWSKLVLMSGRDLKGAFAGIGGMMPQQQVGKKRGFFSKLLGVAAPFLGMIPGVGPLLSTLAGMGSAAAGGDWGSVLTQGLTGFSSGGAFRRTSSAPAASSSSPPPVPSAANLGHELGHLPGRARGGPVSRGRAYLVGEERAEVFTPDEDGFIHSSLDAFSRKFGGGEGHSGGGRQGRGGKGGTWNHMIERMLAALEQNTQASTQLHTRVESMPAGDMLAIGARQNPGAIGDGLMRAGTRDPKVVEWMQRRTA